MRTSPGCNGTKTSLRLLSVFSSRISPIPALFSVFCTVRDSVIRFCVVLREKISVLWTGHSSRASDGWQTGGECCSDSVSGYGGAFNRSMQHHLGTKLFKGGVYDPTKTVETYFCGKDRDLAPMEVRAVPARRLRRPSE